MQNNQNSSPQNLPIGVFDSGVGGLTVLKVLANHLPDEHFLYLGDSARLPYGTKSPQTIRKYSEQALGFLADMGVKALVIACNSASSQFRESHFRDIPVENVIDPGAVTALRATQGRIGILGTRATVTSKVYESALLELAQSKNRKVEVFAAAAPLFVPLAEEGWIDDPITNLIVFRYLQPLIQQNIDTLILGCTHYPILRASIQRAVGNSVSLIDSGEALAENLRKKFDNQVLFRRNPAEDLGGSEQSKSSDANLNPQSNRRIDILSTEESSTFSSMARRLLGEKRIDSIKVVNL